MYWLTIHCKGDAQNTVLHLKRFLPIEAYSYLEKIRPTDWDVLKTDAIDFSQDFRWFDDSPMQSEERILIGNNSLEKLILIDLKNNPNQLKEFINQM